MRYTMYIYLFDPDNYLGKRITRKCYDADDVITTAERIARAQGMSVFLFNKHRNGMIEFECNDPRHFAHLAGVAYPVRNTRKIVTRGIEHSEDICIA